jgi:hypothetical protein
MKSGFFRMNAHTTARRAYELWPLCRLVSRRAESNLTRESFLIDIRCAAAAMGFPFDGNGERIFAELIPELSGRVSAERQEAAMARARDVVLRAVAIARGGGMKELTGPVIRLAIAENARCHA